MTNQKEKRQHRLTADERELVAGHYAEHRMLIADTVGRFVRCNGGNFDELRAEADTIFMNAYFSGNIDRTGVRRWVWFELYDQYRQKLTHRQKLQYREIATYEVPGVADDIGQKWLDADRDVSHVVRLLFDVNGPVHAAAVRRGGEPRNFRAVLRAHLAGTQPVQAGHSGPPAPAWSRDRINTTFSTISEML